MCCRWIIGNWILKSAGESSKKIFSGDWIMNLTANAIGKWLTLQAV